MLLQYAEAFLLCGIKSARKLLQIIYFTELRVLGFALCSLIVRGREAKSLRPVEGA